MGELGTILARGLAVLAIGIGGTVAIGLLLLWINPTFDCHSLSEGEFNSGESYKMLTGLYSVAQSWLHAN